MYLLLGPVLQSVDLFQLLPDCRVHFEWVVVLPVVMCLLVPPENYQQWVHYYLQLKYRVVHWHPVDLLLRRQDWKCQHFLLQQQHHPNLIEN